MLGNTPALLTQMSRPPNSAMTDSVPARTDAASVTSIRTPDDPCAESTRDVGCCGLRQSVVDVGDGDVGAGLSKPECDRLTQALGAPGDKRSAAGERQEVAHGCARDVGERVAHASTSAGIALCCAIWPSQARLGLGVRAKVSRSIAIRPNVGSQ